jgi:hypothetical protein
VLAPQPARAASDWFASVYSPGGVEVRADERLFTLYALLNTMGYDDAPVVRKFPVPKREFSPVRVRVRNALSSLDPKLKDQVSAFFDKHSLPLSKYAAFTLQLGPAPQFTAPAGAQPAELVGFDKLLAQVYEQAKVRDLFAQVQDEYRADTKTYLTAIDGPMGEARKLLHDPSTKAVVAVNSLDGLGAAEGVSVDNGAVLVLGPSPKPSVAAAVRAYARLVLEPVVSKKANLLKGAAEQAAVVRGSGGPALEGAQDYATELLARAIAVKAAGADGQAELDQGAKEGFAGLKEAVKGLDDWGKGDKALDVLVADLLGKIDLKKAALPGKGN